MLISAERFSKSAIACLPEEERELRLRELEWAANQHLAGCESLSAFQERLYPLIDELCVLGFSLGRWDYDCEVEIWGGPSYMDVTLEDDLLLRSQFPAGVSLAWKDFERPPK